MTGKLKVFTTMAVSALVAALLSLIPVTASAVTTNLNAGEEINLATVINSGLSLQIGDKVFDGFSWDNYGSLDLDMAASNVNVRALSNLNDIGFRLEFQLPLTAGDMDFKDIVFEYTAAVTNSSNLISDLHLSVTGATSGDAIGSVAETADAGGFGAGLVGSVSVALPGPPTNSATNLNYAVAKLWIEKDIIVSGAFEFTDDSASISTIDQTFSQIPEPSTALLVGLGLLGVVAANRKRKS
jgi:PEP-CTERM motif